MLAIMEENNQSNKAGFNREIPVSDLIERIRTGDMLAMEALYHRYKIPIFNIAYRFCFDPSVAEDLLQEIFLKVYLRLKSLRQEEAFKTWLYRIAMNTCISYLRKRKMQRHKVVPFNQVEWKAEVSVTNADNEMIKYQLNEAIRNLSEKLRSVFLLHDVQGFKHKEIAQILGCTEGTSKSQLFKARMKIRQHFEKK